MPARRCSICSENWPDDDLYKLCPACQLPTNRFSNVKAMPNTEAVERANAYSFERFYDDWDDERPSVRLVPDHDDDIESRFPIDLVPDNIDDLVKLRSKHRTPKTLLLEAGT